MDEAVISDNDSGKSKRMSEDKDEKEVNVDGTGEPVESEAAGDQRDIDAESAEVSVDETSTPLPSELNDEDLKALMVKAGKAEENWDKYVRLSAEFENFRKRSAREKTDAIRYANEALIEQLLPTIDHFDMALAATQSGADVNVKAIQTGVKMVYDQFVGILKDCGLEEVEAEGKPFDPLVHEALSQEESDSAEEGTILRQLRKGYKLRDRLIRAANVVVAKAASSEGQGDPGETQGVSDSD